jgi:hypothetical protein
MVAALCATLWQFRGRNGAKDASRGSFSRPTNVISLSNLGCRFGSRLTFCCVLTAAIGEFAAFALQRSGRKNALDVGHRRLPRREKTCNSAALPEQPPRGIAPEPRPPAFRFRRCFDSLEGRVFSAVTNIRPSLDRGGPIDTIASNC